MLCGVPATRRESKLIVKVVNMLPFARRISSSSSTRSRGFLAILAVVMAASAMVMTAAPDASAGHNVPNPGVCCSTIEEATRSTPEPESEKSGYDERQEELERQRRLNAQREAESNATETFNGIEITIPLERNPDGSITDEQARQLLENFRATGDPNICATCYTRLDSNTRTPASVAAPPVCKSASSDPDGDGWGWENNRSCTVHVQQTSSVIWCTSRSSDSDGDGWGWENNRSCKMP